MGRERVLAGRLSDSLSWAGTLLRGLSCFSLLASRWNQPGPPPPPEQLLRPQGWLPQPPALNQCGRGPSVTPRGHGARAGLWEGRGKPFPSPSAALQAPN